MEFAWVHQSHLLRAHQIWFTHRGILAMPVIHIHLLLTEAHNQTEGKTNTEHGLVNTRVTCGLPLPFEWLWNQFLFSLLPLFPSSSNPLCLLHHAIPAFFGNHFGHFPSFPPWLKHNPSFILAGAESSLSVPSSFLPFPPSCEIAVVSYGFLFLRDGRWVHVGVEATKHAVSAQHAGQHTQRVSCGYDSCHAHISALPVIKNVHTVKNRTREGNLFTPDL